MGSDKAKETDTWDDEQPRHTVFVEAFEIGRYPLTVAQFEAFVKATGHKTAARKKVRDMPIPGLVGRRSMALTGDTHADPRAILGTRPTIP